jgi:hypothetical protein
VNASRFLVYIKRYTCQVPFDAVLADTVCHYVQSLTTPTYASDYHGGSVCKDRVLRRPLLGNRGSRSGIPAGPGSFFWAYPRTSSGLASWTLSWAVFFRPFGAGVWWGWRRGDLRLV